MCALNHERQTSCECYVARDNADQEIQNEIYKNLHRSRQCHDYCRGLCYDGRSQRQRLQLNRQRSPSNQELIRRVGSLQAGKFAEAGKLYSQIVCSKSEGLFGNAPAGSHCIAFQPARRRTEMAGKSNKPEAGRHRSKNHAGPSVLSPRRFPKSSGCAEGRRREQQQADS